MKKTAVIHFSAYLMQTVQLYRKFARNISARFIQKTCKNILTMLKMRDIITNVVKPTQAIHETKLFQMTEKVKHFLHFTANIP